MRQRWTKNCLYMLRLYAADPAVSFEDAGKSLGCSRNSVAGAVRRNKIKWVCSTDMRAWADKVRAKRLARSSAE